MTFWKRIVRDEIIVWVFTRKKLIFGIYRTGGSTEEKGVGEGARVVQFLSFSCTFWQTRGFPPPPVWEILDTPLHRSYKYCKLNLHRAIVVEIRSQYR